MLCRMVEWSTPRARVGTSPFRATGHSGGVEDEARIPTIKLADGGGGSGYLSPRYPTDLMRWERVHPKADYPDDLVVYGHYALGDALAQRARTRVAFVGESRGVAWWTYEFLEDHLDFFDHVLTYDESIVAMDPQRCQFVPRGECWIEPEDVAIYAKTRLVSFISSGKGFERWRAIGHGLRVQLYDIATSGGGCLGRRLRRAGVLDRLDLYGSITGVNLPTKLPSLKDYMFQISVENMIHDTYFTEKIIDCFATGTIPIYRGTRGVERYFDPRGIIFFDSIEELTDILVGLTEDDYYSRLDAVRENYRRAAGFFSREELICRYSDLLSW